MNRLQASEKRYANLKMLWERERQLTAELLETLKSIQQMAKSDLREFDIDHLFTWQIETDAQAAIRAAKGDE